MWAIVLLPVALIAFRFISVLAVSVLLKYGSPALQPVADRIRKSPEIWGYILVFGTLAAVMALG